MTLPLFTWCEVCGGPEAKETTRETTLNGLPIGVRICRDCREAVRLCEVGIVLRPNQVLYITDGREAVSA
jgi:NAD-dependent dihydropyrimidine dehydrogenase PreA subunit